MSNFTNRREQAIEACDKVIYGIEDETLSVSSALLTCKKIARLVNDLEGQEWLGYEYGGYPQGDNGKILHDAWQMGANHGRMYKIQNGENKTVELIFTELCGELESVIETNRKALNNYSTQGFSVAGDQAIIATNNMTANISISTNRLLNNIKQAEKRLLILKSHYYDYAVKWKIELYFGNTAKTVFEEYQERVDRNFSSLSVKTLQKLNAIQDLLEDGNPERYAQVLASCRRLWSETAKQLFAEFFPDYSERTYKTKSGRDIDVSGDHDNNKLSAVIETLQAKAAKNTLVGSETIYIVDWLEQINNSQNTGVHTNVTREQAMQCIIHTYIALGDILSLKAEAEQNK